MAVSTSHAAQETILASDINAIAALANANETDIATNTSDIATNTSGIAAIVAAKGQANGYASLDGTGKVPTAQLPTTTSTPVLTTIEPTGVQWSTVPRYAVNTGSASTLTSGTLVLAGIYLPSGTVVSSLKMWSGGTGSSSQTNAWMGLYDQNRVQLATTSDRTTTAIGSVTFTSFPIAATAAGAAASFTTTYSGLHYIGLMVKATSVCNLFGVDVGQSTYTNAQVPILCGNSSTGQTTPPAFPFTATAITAGTTGVPYFAVA